MMLMQMNTSEMTTAVCREYFLPFTTRLREEEKPKKKKKIKETEQSSLIDSVVLRSLCTWFKFKIF
jgi:hypothetical protein